MPDLYERRIFRLFEGKLEENHGRRTALLTGTVKGDSAASLCLSPLRWMGHDLREYEGRENRPEVLPMQTHSGCRITWALLRKLSNYWRSMRRALLREEISLHRAMMLPVCSAAGRKRGLIPSLRRKQR